MTKKNEYSYKHERNLRNSGATRRRLLREGVRGASLYVSDEEPERNTDAEDIIAATLEKLSQKPEGKDDGVE